MSVELAFFISQVGFQYIIGRQFLLSVVDPFEELIIRLIVRRPLVEGGVLFPLAVSHVVTESVPISTDQPDV